MNKKNGFRIYLLKFTKSIFRTKEQSSGKTY